jgi:hypothetical protein
LLGNLAAASNDAVELSSESGGRHRLAARPKGLDRSPDCLAALRLPRRESVHSVNFANLARVASKCFVAADKAPFRMSGRGLSPPAVIADATRRSPAPLFGRRQGLPLHWAVAIRFSAR